MEGELTVPWTEAVVTELSFELANRVRGKKPGPLTAWPAWFLWGTVALAFWLGSRLGEGRWDSAVLSILLGLLGLKVLGFVPIVRWLAFAVVSVLAVGAAFASRFGFRGPSLQTPAVPK